MAAPNPIMPSNASLPATPAPAPNETRCSCRRHAPTNLRCMRCDKPICPDCSVVAPVGHQCRECGRSRNASLLQASAGGLVLAFAASLGVALFGGWLLLGMGGGFGFFGLWIAYFYGLLVAETALRVTGRKRGLPMEIVAGVNAALGLVIGWLLPILARGGPQMLALLAASLHPSWTYILVGVAVFAAVSRMRNL